MPNSLRGRLVAGRSGVSSVPVTRDLSARAGGQRAPGGAVRSAGRAPASDRGAAGGGSTAARQSIPDHRAARGHRSAPRPCCRDLYARAQREPVDSERVHIALQELGHGRQRLRGRRGSDELKVHTARGAVRARGANQTEYLNNIRTHDLTFGIGPAGTGKTYLAVACAVEALQSERVRRIVLVRPAVEAGERLGFCPAICRRRSIPTCARCMTRCTK